MDPVRIGPAGFPPENRTLGWAILGWQVEYLKQPDGPNAGEPWKLTTEQLRFLLWWYALDERGRFVYRRGVFRRMKGHGKDPLAASLALSEFCGPCRFDGWDADGLPVAAPHPAPWVQVAATNQDQTRNTMTLLPGMLSDEAIDEYGVDLGKTIVYSRGGGRIEAVTSSPRAIEGGRPTYVVANEALALDTPVPTPSGWTSMGALRDGDVIYGADGTPTTVVKALPVQHNRRCYRVTFADGTSVVASDGHLWLTRRAGATNTVPRVRTTEDLVADGRTFRVPAPGPRRAPARPLPVDPYLLGYWLGDGARGGCHLTVGDEDLADVQRLLKERGVDTTVLRRDLKRASRLSFSYRRGGFGAAMGSEQARGLRALACYRDKHIPAAYLTASVEQRTELLRGLMDSDGCATQRGRCVFVGTERLARDVLELLRSLGQQPRLAYAADVRSRDGGSWRVGFTPRRGLQPFALLRKAERVRGHGRGPDWVTITSIEPVESVPVRCIAVDAVDHLFQAGEAGIVTHNTHHWIDSNEGKAMWKAIARNLAKSRDGSARALAITNAHEPGEGSVAEDDWDAYQAIESGRSRGTGFLYDSLQAPDDVDLSDREQLREALMVARGDSTWLDVDRLLEEINDPTTSPSVSRRFYLNQITAAEDAWIAPWQWAGCADATKSIGDGETVTLGFDGSVREDATALVACRVQDGHLELLGCWERPNGPAGRDWQVDRQAVDQAVATAMERYRVVGFYADPPHWQDYLDRWSQQYGPRMLLKASATRPLEWWTNRVRSMVTALERFYEAVVSRDLTHDGDSTLTRHVLNAKRRVGPSGVTIAKEHPQSPRKIDAVMAAVLAYEARADAVARRLDRSSRRTARSGRGARGF